MPKLSTKISRLFPVPQWCRLVVFVGFGLLTNVSAQTLYWDTNGATAGSSGTNGTWGTNNYWSTSAAGTAATTAFTSGRDTVFSAGTNATGSFIVTVNGTQNVSSINIEEGTVTFTGGTINFNDATPDFIVGTGLTTTVNSVISGTNGLTKGGTGLLVLAGNNSFTGATSITAGNLQIKSANALGSASNSSNTTVAAGAALQIANSITTGNSGTLILNGTGTGSGALQSVSGNNTWNSNVTLTSNASIFSSTAGQTLTLGNSSATNLFSLGANTVTFDGPGDTWINSNLGVSGDTGGLIKNGTGKLTLYGYNTFTTGATFVNTGSLDLIVGPFNPGIYGLNGALTIGTGPANSGAAGTVSVNIATNSYNNQLSPSSAVTINSDGILNVGSSTGLGSLTLNGGQVSITAGVIISPTGNITANANTAHQTSLISGGQISLGGPTTFTIDRDATLTSDLSISSVIAGSALTKAGLGILNLSGANTYTGGTTLNAGVLALGNNNALGSGDLTINGGTVLATGGSRSVGNNVVVGGDFSIGGSNNLTLNGSINLGGGIRTITVDNTATTTFAGSVTEPWYSGIIKAGSGELVLSGNNSFTAPVQVNAGTLTLAHSNALGGTGTWGNTVAADAMLALTNNITVNEGGFTVTGTGVGGNGAIRNVSGNNTLTAAIDLGGNTTFNSVAGAFTSSGQINLGSGNTLTVAGAGNTTFSGAINGNSSITKNDSGTLTFSGTGGNSYGGALNINDGTVVLNKTAGTPAVSGSAINVGDGVGGAGSAVLRLGAANQIADYSGTLTVNSDGRFDLNNLSEKINSLAGTGQINLGTTGALTVGVNSGNSTFGGTVLGSGTLIKEGSGSLTLAASLAITGELQLNQGTIFLGGNNLTTGTLHITGNSTIDFGGGNSTLNTTNFLLDAGVTLSIQNWTNAADFFYAQNWSGATFNISGSAPMNQVTFASFTANDTGWQSIDNQVKPIPEPSTYGAMMLSLLVLFRLKFRRGRDAG